VEAYNYPTNRVAFGVVVRILGRPRSRRVGPKEARQDRPMTADFLPLRLLLLSFAGWVNRHQQHVIDYLIEENRVLREQLRGRRVRLTDDQR
jgi:hypothetical protein